MFDWLEQEFQEVKTRRFHVIDGPASDSLKLAIEKSDLPVPRTYKDFVVRFGNAKLYRKLSYYLIGVSASPIETLSQEGETFFRFGHYDAASAYFKKSLLRNEEESPVFEGKDGRLHQVADGFEAWLMIRCKAARKKYTKNEWSRIVAGPSPFTAGERRIIETRRLFKWHVAGIASDGKLQFEVYNGSDTVLPYLSVGIRRKDRSFEGGVWLPVSNIAPKQTALIEQDCFSKQAAPGELEAFSLSDPEPEDRDRYWEFRGS